MGSHNPVLLCKYLQKRQEYSRKVLSVSYDKYVSENSYKFTGLHHDEKLKQLALHDLDTFKRFAGLIQKPIKPMDLIKLSEPERARIKPKYEWTLDDYRKSAPQELAKDPELYQRLIKEDKEWR